MFSKDSMHANMLKMLAMLHTMLLANMLKTALSVSMLACGSELFLKRLFLANSKFCKNRNTVTPYTSILFDDLL